MESRAAAPSTTATTPMVIIVDVVSAHTPDTAAELDLERVEIDVDVTPQYTTADMLVADVAAALQVMQLHTCVPAASAALAHGNVLPTLSTLQQAVRQCRHAQKTRVGVHKIEELYAGALRRAQAAAVDGASRTSATAARPPAALQVRAGSAYMIDNATAAEVLLSTTWCIVPCALIAAVTAVRRNDNADAHAAAQTSSRPAVTRPSASFVTGAPQSGTPAAPPSAAAAAAADQDGATTTTTAPPSNQSGGADALLGPQATTASAGLPKAASRLLASAQAAGSHRASPTAAPLLAPPSDAPVVALEDVGVMAFRRLQAHHTEMLMREARDLDEASAGAAAAAVAAGTAAAEVVAEQRRLTPTLPWAAVEAPARAKADRRHDDGARTHGGRNGDSAEDWKGAPPAPSANASRARRSSAGVTPSPPLLRAQWLAAVAAEVQSYRSETAALQRATERAWQWRESTKAQLRAEVAQLDAEVTQRRDAVTQRDVLRRRVEQLEAEVAAAKAAEMALLMTAKSAVKAAAAATAATHPSTALAAANGDTNARAPAHASSSQSRSSSTASSSSSDTPPPPAPPPPQAYTTALGSGAAGRRWAGRRVPLRRASDTERNAEEVDIEAESAVQRSTINSRSRHSVERSFLSPSLQAEVAAALASDEDVGTPAAPQEGTYNSMSRPHHRPAAAAAAAGPAAFSDAEASTFMPSREPRRRRQRSGAPSTSSAAAPPFTPPCSAHTVSYSPYPNMPAPRNALRHAHAHDDGAALGEARDAAAATPWRSPAPESVEELRQITDALRRHIRAPQPDPLEGQRLLQQVRALRAEIEKGSGSHHDTDDGDARETTFGGYRNNSPYRPRSSRDAPAALAARGSHRSLTDRGFASAVLGYSEATSMTMDRSRVQESGVRRSPSVDSPAARSLGHGHLRPTWHTSNNSIL